MTTFTLRLLGVPCELCVRNRRHLDDLVHELHVVAAGRATGIEVHSALASSIDAILEKFSEPRDAMFVSARDALLAGRDTVDVDLTLPVAAVDEVRRVLALLEEAEQLCRTGVLLTMPAAPELWELRHWVVEEVARQAHGEEPHRFTSQRSEGG